MLICRMRQWAGLWSKTHFKRLDYAVLFLIIWWNILSVMLQAEWGQKIIIALKILISILLSLSCCKLSNQHAMLIFPHRNQLINAYIVNVQLWMIIVPYYRQHLNILFFVCLFVCLLLLCSREWNLAVKGVGLTGLIPWSDTTWKLLLGTWFTSVQQIIIITKEVSFFWRK